MNIDISDCFDYGIEKFKQNMAFYVVGFIVIGCVLIGLYVISQILSSYLGLSITLDDLIGFQDHLDEIAIKIIINGVIWELLGILLIPFMVGYYRGIKKEYEGGTAEISDVFSAFDIIMPCLLNCIVANLIVIAGGICCIIPGILLSPLVNLSIFFLVKGETQGLNALKRSWETLKKKPILILWTIALGIFAKLGLLVCCVGVFATAPIAMCATYKLFQQAIGEDNKPAPVQTDENAPLPS